MIAAHIKMAWRFLKRNKFTSVINIAGLGISLSAFIFMVLFIRTELSYDTSHPDHERIYRVTGKLEGDNYTENSSSCPFRTGEALLEEFPDYLENQVRFFDFQVPAVAVELENGETFSEKYFYFTDPSVFNMLDFRLVSGDTATVLREPMTAVISRDLAEKYFKGENPIGKTFKYDGKMATFEITGVYEQGGVSHIRSAMLLSMSSIKKLAPGMDNNWVWNPVWTYIKLKPGVSAESFEKEKLPVFVDKYAPAIVKNMASHYLQPISDIHLHSHLEFEMGINSDVKYLYIFATCALFLLIIACVNFVNLTTATSLLRAREIGIRKVFGGSATQLKTQFFTETVFTALLAFLIAFVTCLVFTPAISKLSGIAFNWQLLSDPVIILIFSLTVISVGMISGLFPALFISSLSPVVVLKGMVSGNKNSKRIRKTLVVLQFTLAMVLMTFTFVAVKQLNYMKNKDYGFHTKGIVLLKSSRTHIPFRLDEFKRELLKDPAVLSVTIMNEVLGTNNNNHEFNHEGIPTGQWNYYPALIIDEDFVRTVGLDIIAGSDYDPRLQREDSLSILINRSMSKMMGFARPEDAVGKRLHSLSGKEKIKGVVEDFHYKSFHSSIGPIVLDIESKKGAFYYFVRNVAVHCTEVTPQLLSHLETVWNSFVQDKPFEYRLLHEELNKMYEGEDRLSKVLVLFSMLTIFIACLGLFSLAYFIAQQKTKEISIRKVLGASYLQLFYVGYKEQFVLVIISFLLSVPAGLLLTRNWLSGFAYHVDVGWFPFLVSGMLAIFISAITVLAIFYRSLKRDPAEVLRHE